MVWIYKRMFESYGWPLVERGVRPSDGNGLIETIPLWVVIFFIACIVTFGWRNCVPIIVFACSRVFALSCVNPWTLMAYRHSTPSLTAVKERRPGSHPSLEESWVSFGSQHRSEATWPAISFLEVSVDKFFMSWLPF